MLVKHARQSARCVCHPCKLSNMRAPQADIVHRAEYGTAQGGDIGTNKVFGVHSIFHPAPAKPHHFH